MNVTEHLRQRQQKLFESEVSTVHVILHFSMVSIDVSNKKKKNFKLFCATLQVLLGALRWPWGVLRNFTCETYLFDTEIIHLL